MEMWWADALDSGREVVALEFADGTFVVLPNCASGGMEFDVMGEDVHNALMNNKGKGGVLHLWHTHESSNMPSLADLAWFPEWLCDVAKILVLATGAVVTYNKSGFISRRIDPKIREEVFASGTSA